MGMLRSQPDHHFGPSDRGTLSDNVAETTQGETEPIGDRLAGATCLPSDPCPTAGAFLCARIQSRNRWNRELCRDRLLPQLARHAEKFT